MRNLHYLFLALVVTGGIYCLGVSGPLLFDDGVNLEPLQRVESGLVPWYAVVLTNPSSSMGRPVSVFSFLLNYWFFGFNVVAFKAVNIGLHLGIGAALYVLLRRLLRCTPFCETRDRIALAVTGCWLLSPLYISTVLYVVQRMAMLSTLFTILALSSYLLFRASLEGGRIRWGAVCLYCIYALFGVFSKESAVLLPLFISVIELFFCDPITVESRKRLWRWSMGLLVATPIAVVSVAFYIKQSTLFDYGTRNFNLYERLLTESRIVWSYVGSLLIPRSSDFGLFHDDISVSKNVLSPVSTIVSLLAWCGVVAWICYARSKRVWRPLAGCAAFYLVGHLLESTAFPLELYFEHRNYLPGFGVYLLFILLIELAVRREVVTARGAKLALCAYLAVFAVALSQRSLIWSRYDTIVYSSYRAHPESARANIEAASQDILRGNLNDAMEKLEYVRNARLASGLGVGIQKVWAYCMLNKSGLQTKVESLVGSEALDGSPYTSLAMTQLNEVYKNRPCDNVPYAQVANLLADRIIDYYRTDAYNSPEGRGRGNIDSLRTRVLEALALSGEPQKIIELVAAINQVGIGGVESDLFAAVALIRTGQLEKAGDIIQKLKNNRSMQVKMEAGHIADVEAMYQMKLQDEGAHGG